MRIWRNIIILIIVFAILIAAYYFVKVFQPGKDEQNQTGGSIIIFQTEKKSVTKIYIKNAEGNYAFVLKDNQWLVEGSEFMELNQSAVDSLAYEVSLITTNTLVTSSPESLDSYGLERPIATITVTFDEGNTKTFYLGDLTPTKTHYYFKDSEKDDIYIVALSKGNVFLERLLNYRVRHLITLDKSSITGITIEREADTLELSYTPPSTEEESYGYLSLWNITKPISRQADNEKLDKLVLTPISSIYADNIVEDNPTDLSKYNIGKYKVTITTKDGVKTFEAGKANDNVYVYLNEKTSVYSISENAISFIDIDVFDIMERFITLPVIDSVSQIEITSPEVSATLKIARDGESTRYFLYDTETNEDAFKSIYQKVVGLSVDGMVTKVTEKIGLLCKIVYNMVDGSTKVIEIYPYDDLNVSVFDNGENLFFMKRKSLTDLLNALTKFKENPTEKIV